MREAVLARLVLLVCPVDLALKVPRVLLEKKVHLERKDLRVQLVVMESRVRSVCPAPRGLRVHLERMVTRERSESPDRREAKPTKENRVLLVRPVSKVPSVPQVLPELMESQVPEVSRVCSGRRETKAPEVSPVLLVPSGCRVFLDPLVRRERMATSVQWVLLVHLVPEVLRVPVELMVLKVLLAVWGRWDPWVRRVNKVRLETQDLPESLELGDPKARGVRREKPALPEPLVPLVLRDPPEMTVQRVTPVLSASLEILALLESLVLLARTESLARRERMVKPDNQDRRDHREKLAPQDPPAREDLQELLVRRADKERRAPRERLEQRVLQVKPDQSDPRDPPESPVLRG